MADIFLILIFGGFFLLFWFFYSRLEQRIERQKEINLNQQRMIEEIKEKLMAHTFLQESLKEVGQKTKELVEEISKKKEAEKNYFEMIKHMYEVISGGTSKGGVGEEILREVFQKLPPDMMEKNFKIGGKIVEFALVLPNGKKVPIDSKWPAENLILDLEKETDFRRKKEIIEKIEQEVLKRVKEVQKYIEPPVTFNQAICAIPDSVYKVCKFAHLEAKRMNVLLVPYSLALPFILYFWNMNLQYLRSVEWESIQDYVEFVGKNIEDMERILENKIMAGLRMIQNAYGEYRHLLSKTKGLIFELKSGKEIKQLKEKINVSSD